MSERNWDLIHCLGYLYNSFAVYTDADLDPAEMKEIRSAIGEWASDKSGDEINKVLDTTFNWFKEDLPGELADDDNHPVISNMVGIAHTLKENLTENNCKAVHNDLIRIGNADGHYDEVEQRWATALAEEMGIS
jgi:hypothetical protein